MPSGTPFLSQSRGRGMAQVSGAECAVMDSVMTALAVGLAGGGYIGYHVGNWRAARRAAKATYRTQRGLR